MLDPAHRQLINEAADKAYDAVTARYVKAVNANGKTWFWITFAPYLAAGVIGFFALAF